MNLFKGKCPTFNGNYTEVNTDPGWFCDICGKPADCRTWFDRKVKATRCPEHPYDPYHHTKITLDSIGGLSDEKLIKLNELIGLFVTDERLRWYLAGLIDGYKMHGRKL